MKKLNTTVVAVKENEKGGLLSDEEMDTRVVVVKESEGISSLQNFTSNPTL